MKPNLFSILGTMIKAQKFKVLLRIFTPVSLRDTPLLLVFCQYKLLTLGRMLG